MLVTCIVHINSVEYYNSYQHVYNIAGIDKVDIKDQYTKEDKYNIMNSLHNNILGHRGSSAKNCF